MNLKKYGDRMNVAIVVPSLEVVGPVKVAFDIASSLYKEIDMTVYYLKKSSGLHFPCQTKKLTWRNFFELYRFDVLHSHMLRPDILIAALPFFKGKKFLQFTIWFERIFITHTGKGFQYWQPKFGSSSGKGFTTS